MYKELLEQFFSFHIMASAISFLISCPMSVEIVVRKRNYVILIWTIQYQINDATLVFARNALIFSVMNKRTDELAIDLGSGENCISSGFLFKLTVVMKKNEQCQFLSSTH